MISQQGCSSEPHGAAPKILYLSGFLFGMLVFNSFCANIISTLSSSKSIDSIQEFLEYGQMR